MNYAYIGLKTGNICSPQDTQVLKELSFCDPCDHPSIDSPPAIEIPPTLKSNESHENEGF